MKLKNIANSKFDYATETAEELNAKQSCIFMSYLFHKILGYISC